MQTCIEDQILRFGCCVGSAAAVRGEEMRRPFPCDLNLICRVVLTFDMGNSFCQHYASAMAEQIEELPLVTKFAGV